MSYSADQYRLIDLHSAQRVQELMEADFERQKQARKVPCPSCGVRALAWCVNPLGVHLGWCHDARQEAVAR